MNLAIHTASLPIAVFLIGVAAPSGARSADGPESVAQLAQSQPREEDGIEGSRTARQAELMFWNSIKDSRHAADYEAYLEAFPNGIFVVLAKTRAERYYTSTPKTPAPAGPEIEEIESLFEVVTNSNLRQAPTAKSERIGSAAAGTQLLATGKVEGTNWYRVKIPEGGVGYIYGDLIKKITPQQDTELARVQAQQAIDTEKAAGDAKRLAEARKAAEKARQQADAKRLVLSRLETQITAGARQRAAAKKAAAEARQRAEAAQAAESEKRLAKVRTVAAEARRLAEAEKAAEEARQQAEAKQIAEESLRLAEAQKTVEETQRLLETKEQALAQLETQLTAAAKRRAEARKAAGDSLQRAEAKRRAEEAELLAEEKKADAEARRRAEARKAAEEAERLAEEKKAAEDARLLAEARKAAEEARRLADSEVAALERLQGRQGVPAQQQVAQVQRTQEPRKAAGSKQAAVSVVRQAEAKEAPQVAAATTVQPEPQRPLAGAESFKDCAECPEMVPIPAGEFLMGSSFDNSERPVHRVRIPYSFAIGRYEITIGNWKACARDGVCTYKPEFEDASEHMPMQNISWDDTGQYLAWLRTKTSRPYRLPTESEWEYAARANTTTKFWWGDDAGFSNANCKDCGGVYDRKNPAKVGRYPPNGFGLHDMNGGVWEWVDDCWHHSHEGHPADGSSRQNPDCLRRVLRGGSWRNDASYLRSSSRFYYDAGIRFSVNGARVALTLD